MDIGVLECVRIDTQLFDAVAHQAQRSLNRFFHHITNQPGQRDVSLPWVARGFNVQDLAADESISEARHDAGDVGLFRRHETDKVKVFGPQKAQSFARRPNGHTTADTAGSAYTKRSDIKVAIRGANHARAERSAELVQ